MAEEEDQPRTATVEGLLSMEDTDALHVDLPSGRGRVYYRALSEAEALHLTEVMTDKSYPEFERQLLVTALTEPAMSREQVEQWRKRPGSAGDVQAVTRAVSRSSGLMPDEEDTKAVSLRFSD